MTERYEMVKLPNWRGVAGTGADIAARPGEIWRVDWLRWNYASDANVATRAPFVFVLDGEKQIVPLWESGAATAAMGQTASLDVQWMCVIGNPTPITTGIPANSRIVCLANAWQLNPGKLQLSFTNFQATDQGTLAIALIRFRTP